MTIRLAGALTLAIALALFAVSCSSTSETTTPTTPTTPTAVTEVLSGTLDVQGSKVFTLAAQPGAVTATLKDVGSTPSLAIGISVGHWDGTTCTAVVQNEDARQGAILNGLATANLNLCVRVWDVGNLTSSIAYTVEVAYTK